LTHKNQEENSFENIKNTEALKTCGFYVHITLSGLWKIAVGEIHLLRRDGENSENFFDGAIYYDQ